MSTSQPNLDISSHFAWIRTRLSADRTLLSWDRTSIALIGFGFTIYQFFRKFQESTAGGALARPEASRNMGLALVLVGTVGSLIALWQYVAVVLYLRGNEFKDIGRREGMPHWALPGLITVVLALIGILTTAWIALRG